LVEANGAGGGIGHTGRIKVAIVGVGNCAASLVQTIHAASSDEELVGITHPLIGKYRVADIELAAAFDVDSRKVGQDLAEAIFAEPNCTTRYVDVPPAEVTVSPGMALDGVSDQLRSLVRVGSSCNSTSIVDIEKVLRDTETEMVLIFLPVGAARAADAYATAAIRAACSLINFTPARLATSKQWSDRFAKAGKVLLGDDTKSQLGSTVVHRALLSLLQQQGVRVTGSYQLNVGGNADFKNMEDPDRAAYKVTTKRAALVNLVGDDVPITGGPNGYMQHLRDFKSGYISIDGTGLLGMPVSIEVKLRVEDSPNAAAVAVNAIRLARLASDYGCSGTIDAVCAQLFKNPPYPMSDAEAYRSFEAFIEGKEDGNR
jgi:myo-inositol-1-phosphate synthase